MTRISQWLKPNIEFNTKKGLEAEKNNNKGEKALYKLMNNPIYRKTMEKLRNRIKVKLVNNKKEFNIFTSKPSMSHKIFDNNLVAIRKGKLALKFNKSAYIGMCILELRKVLIYEFHYNYIKNKYGNNSGLSFTDTDSLFMKLKLKMFMKILAAINKYLILVIIQLSENTIIIQTS